LGSEGHDAGGGTFWRLSDGGNHVGLGEDLGVVERVVGEVDHGEGSDALLVSLEDGSTDGEFTVHGNLGSVARQLLELEIIND